MRGLMFAPLLMLTACAATTANTPMHLAGTSWKLASASGGALAIPEASAVTMEFSAERAAGHSGCNQYSGPYTLRGSTLTLGPVVATKRACIGPGGQVEAAWFAALAKPIEVSMAQDELRLVTGAGETLRLRAATKP
jgi:heat shock protein HslJ